MSMDEKNLAIVRQSFANAALGHKIQEVAADRKDAIVKKLKWFELVLVGAVLVLFIVQAQIPDNLLFSYIGAGLTVAEILLLLIKQTFHFDDDVVAHKNAASKYLGLRDRYRLLVSDSIDTTIEQKELQRRRDALLHEYQLIIDLSLPTTGKDYDEAMKRMKLEQDGENVWSDNQIDHLLPKELRKQEGVIGVCRESTN